MSELTGNHQGDTNELLPHFEMLAVMSDVPLERFDEEGRTKLLEVIHQAFIGDPWELEAFPEGLSDYTHQLGELGNAQSLRHFYEMHQDIPDFMVHMRPLMLRAAWEYVRRLLMS